MFTGEFLFMNRCWIDAQCQWMHCSQSNYGPSRCPARDSTSDGRGAGFKRLLGTFCRWYALGECSRAMQSGNAVEECDWRMQVKVRNVSKSKSYYPNSIGCLKICEEIDAQWCCQQLGAIVLLIIWDVYATLNVNIGRSVHHWIERLGTCWAIGTNCKWIAEGLQIDCQLD